MEKRNIVYEDKRKQLFFAEIEINDSILLKSNCDVIVSPKILGLTTRQFFEAIGKRFNPRTDYKSPQITITTKP